MKARSQGALAPRQRDDRGLQSSIRWYAASMGMDGRMAGWQDMNRTRTASISMQHDSLSGRENISQQQCLLHVLFGHEVVLEPKQAADDL